MGVALQLARDYGGTRLHFPKRVLQTSKLSRALGFEIARALCGSYGGTYRDIPRFAAQRKLAIARSDGSAPQVARKFNVTERYVRIVRNGKPGDKRQLGFSLTIDIKRRST